MSLLDKKEVQRPYRARQKRVVLVLHRAEAVDLARVQPHELVDLGPELVYKTVFDALNELEPRQDLLFYSFKRIGYVLAVGEASEVRRGDKPEAAVFFLSFFL